MTEATEPPHPKTVAFWVSRIFLGSLIVFVGWCGWRLASTMIGGGTDRLIRDTNWKIDSDKAPKPPKPMVYDATWARRKRAEIAALDSEVQAAKEAYSRHETSVKSRTISREDDRKESSRLNQIVLDIEKKRAEAAASFAEHDEGK